MAGAFTHRLGCFNPAGALPTSAVWALVEARALAGSPAANQDFTNLGGYDELLVVLDGVTCSGSSGRRIHLSVDNGSSFYNSTGDYIDIPQSGSPSSAGEIYLSTTSGTGAQYGFIHIPALTGFQKMALSTSRAGSNQRVFKASSSRVNAVRVTSASADTLNGGTIYVYARTAAWDLLGSNTSPGAVNIDFTSLSAYDEFMLVMAAVTASSAANRRVRYSVNNGSSFYAGATDYQREHTVAGVNTNWTEAQLCSGDTTSPLSFLHHLFNTTGALKAGLSVGGREDDSANDPGHYFKASASAIDAIRLTSGSAATLNGGGIYLYGRDKPWTEVFARSCSGSPAVNQDFTGLGSYDELLFVMDSVGASGNASRNLQVSTDNGSTWHATSGDYFGSYTTGGGKSNADVAATLSAQSSAARSMIVHIPMTTGAMKPILHTANGRFNAFVANSNRINALRMKSDTAFTLNSGTIYVYGR